MPLSLTDNTVTSYTPPAAKGRGALGPILPEERIHAIDLLRGWAMFGVLWSNLNDWYGPRDPVTRFDTALAWTQEWFIEEGRGIGVLVLFCPLVIRELCWQCLLAVVLHSQGGQTRSPMLIRLDVWKIQERRWFFYRP